MKAALRILVRLTLALVVVALLAYGFWPSATEVEIAQITRGRLEVTVDEDGKTRVKERYAVVAPLGGDLLRIELHAGAPVRAGETVLAVIQPGDPSLLDARAHTEAEARVRSAQARLLLTQAIRDRVQASFNFAKSRHARAERLLPSKAVTQEEYDEAVHQLRTATEDARAGEFGVSMATHELELARAALTRTLPGGAADATRLEIRSPIDGEVLQVFRESEGTVVPGERLIELGDRRELEVEIDVLSADAVRIPLGAKVYLEHWGSDQPLLAHVRLVEPQAFLKVSALGVEEQRVNVIADFATAPDSRARLGDAYRVEARIVVAEADPVLKLNSGSLFRYDGGWAVYRIVNNRAVLTAVQVGLSNGLETQIIGGLGSGDQAVAYPSDQVFNGARVTVRQSRR